MSIKVGYIWNHQADMFTLSLWINHPDYCFKGRVIATIYMQDRKPYEADVTTIGPCQTYDLRGQTDRSAMAEIEILCDPYRKQIAASMSPLGV